MKTILVRLMISAAILFQLAGLVLGQPALAQAISAAEIQSETEVTVLLPDLAALGIEELLHPEVIYSGPDGYYVAYGFTPDCADAGFCNYARVQGHRIGSTTSHFKPDTIEELVEERTEVLAEAPYISPDQIETVTLADGTAATVLPWYSYTNPGNTEVLVERDGIRYLFSIEMAPNSDVVEMANSAL